MSDLSPQEEALAKALLAARMTGTPADSKALPAPADNAAAMRVQTWVVKQLGEKIVGWKLGFTADDVAFAGPLLASTVHTAPTRWVQKAGPDFRVEIEIGVRLAKDLPVRPGNPYSREEIIDAIDTVFCGIEMLATRYSDPTNLSFVQGLADSVHNGGYIVGQEKKTKEIPGPLESMTCRATLDGVEIYNAVPKHPWNDIILPVIGYATTPNDGLGGLKAGHVLTTGSLCGVIATPRTGTLVASVSGFDDMVIELAHS